MNQRHSSNIDNQGKSGTNSDSSNITSSATTRQDNVQEIISFFKTLAILIVIAIILRASVVEAFRIPSGSMIPVLKIKDHILVSKFSYGVRLPFMEETLFRFSEPKRGDIVVFTLPDDTSTRKNEARINIIKRVVGIPGDTVELSETKLYINNKLVEEPYARWVEHGFMGGDFGPVKVKPGHVLLLGDNRDHSRDSRSWEEPFLDMNRIKGRALIIYWSWDDLTRIGNIIR